jgi:hypothetical protein
MHRKTIVAVAAILVVLGAGYAIARPANNGFWNDMMGYGGGMMGNNGYGSFGPGYGMMGGYGDMMGSGTGHCGGYGAGYGDTNPITIEEAKEAVEQYLASQGNQDLKLTEVMEFDNHFYAEVEEKSTGVHTFELLVNKYTGTIAPEMGPNMMWNTRYGHMGWYVEATATVTKEQALKNAQAYLDRALPGAKAEDADAFYGYYTIHVLKDGKVYGMLSVNAYTGAIWYHNWHGAFVKMLEV